MSPSRCLAPALAAACFLSTSVLAQDPAPPWPACLPGQVEVILLGTFHMAGSQDDVRRDVDDVLDPTRQTQMAALVERLAAARPDRIALEADVKAQATLNQAYRAYRSGAALTRNERQPIGFRLAALLRHDSVYAVDYPQGIGNDSMAAYYGRHPEVRRRSLALLQAGAELLRPPDADSLLAASTLAAYLAWLNSERALITEGNVAMYAHLVAGEGDNYGGADLFTRWFERNIRMAHHVARIVRPDDRRVLFVVGSGHVRPLRDILDLAPQFCPASPLPYLRE